MCCRKRDRSVSASAASLPPWRSCKRAFIDRRENGGAQGAQCRAVGAERLPRLETCTYEPSIKIDERLIDQQYLSSLFTRTPSNSPVQLIHQFTPTPAPCAILLYHHRLLLIIPLLLTPLPPRNPKPRPRFLCDARGRTRRSGCA